MSPKRLPRCLLLPAAVATLIANPGAVSATVLDFEGVPTGPAFTYVKGAYEVRLNGDIASGPGFCSPECPDNGGQYHLQSGFFAGLGMVNVVRLDGKRFRIDSIDLGEGPIGAVVPDILLAATTAQGVEPMVVSLDQVNDGSGPLVDFETIPLGQGLFADANGLTILVFAPGARFSIDNIVVSQNVPAMGPMALVGLALSLLGGGARRIA